MRSATATGASVGSGLLRTVTVTWPSAAGRPGASSTRTAIFVSFRALSDADTVSWQPLADAVTPTPERTWLSCTEHCGAVSGLSRYWARLTVRLVPAMRPSTVTGRIVAIGGALVTRTRIVKVSAPPLALTATAPVVPARAAAWALRTTCRPPWPTCARSTRSAAGSQVASYAALPASRPSGSHAWHRRGMSKVRAGPSAARSTSWSGHLRTGTSGPICTGTVTYVVWAALSFGPVALVTSSMRAAGP